MRNRSSREVLKVVLPNDKSGMLRDHPRPGHARVTVGIQKIDLPAHEHILIIRAARDQDQRAQNGDLHRDAEPAAAHVNKLAVGP